LLRLAALDGGDRISHGFFTRTGGVSEGIFASLNCGLGSGDRPEAVVENRARVAAALGLPPDRLATIHQVHSARVVAVDGVVPAEDRPRADGLVTRTPGLALGILTADCVPLLFVDPAVTIIGAAHAGWKGARDGVAEATIAAMQALGAEPARIRVGIGPAIRQMSYEVGPEFPAHFPDAAPCFRAAARPGHFLFDLPAYLTRRLGSLGLAAVEDLGLDTLGDPARFFSYRRATLNGETDYGRMLSAIAIN
jgi:YfiH family protein